MTFGFLIPLINAPQQAQVRLAGVQYTLTLIYRDDPGGLGGWVLDIGDALNNPILTGVPLVTGADLLAQYEYLGIGGQLIVATSSVPDAVPTFTNLGGDANLYFVPNP